MHAPKYWCSRCSTLILSRWNEPSKQWKTPIEKVEKETKRLNHIHQNRGERAQKEPRVEIVAEATRQEQATISVVTEAHHEEERVIVVTGEAHHDEERMIVVTEAHHEEETEIVVTEAHHEKVIVIVMTEAHHEEERVIVGNEAHERVIVVTEAHHEQKREIVVKEAAREMKEKITITIVTAIPPGTQEAIVTEDARPVVARKTEKPTVESESDTDTKGAIQGALRVTNWDIISSQRRC